MTGQEDLKGRRHCRDQEMLIEGSRKSLTQPPSLAFPQADQPCLAVLQKQAAGEAASGEGISAGTGLVRQQHTCSAGPQLGLLQCITLNSESAENSSADHTSSIAEAWNGTFALCMLEATHEISPTNALPPRL